MKYWQAKKLKQTEFKRLTGVKKTFRVMVRTVKAYLLKIKKKPGRKPKLIVEDQILIMLEYLREYRTYYHISKTWKMSESNICRIVHKIENILIKSSEFRLPGKKELWQSSSEEELVVMDVMESQIERPKKRQKQFYSGKQKEHTLKTQLVIQQKTILIVCLVNEKGKTYDFKLFKNSGVKFGTLMRVLADKGYQGIAKIHQLSQTPIKKKKGKKLTKEEKQYNRQLNRLRITVEHINRRLKIFKILSYPYRNRGKRFGLRANLIAGLHNYDLAN